MARPRCRHVCVSGLLLYIMVAALKKLSSETEFLTPGTRDYTSSVSF